MKFRTLIQRSLRYHWRSHLGVVVGAAIGSAALIGALIVGDSVKGSLREQAMQRLGVTRFALSSSDRLFGASLASRIHQQVRDRNSNPVPVAAALLISGAAARVDGAARVNGATIIGVELESWSSMAGAEYPQLEWAPGHALLGRQVAVQLGLKVGDTFLLRIPKASALSRDAVMTSRDDASLTLRLEFVGVAGDELLGGFALQAGPTSARNIFLRLEDLQQTAQSGDRANVLLVAGNKPKEEPYRYDSYLSAGLESALLDEWLLADVQAELSFVGDGFTELHTTRVFLDPPIVRSALAADTNAQPLLTYLANLIIVGTNTTPYSMVTAAGAPWTPADLRDDEIVLNQWLADDLQAKPGDAVTLVYYDPESGARLTERTNTFRVRSIVPMQMPWADRTLMPQFPGIEKAETTAEWDTAFPLVHKIRPQDDDYWTEYRGTPKAFITLAAGQKMWANRFGHLTAIRFPVPANLVAQASQPAGSGGIPAAGSEHRAGMPGKPAAKDGRATAETFRIALEKKILATLKPEELGLRFEPVREQALKAVEQSQDFGGLFIGFSLFVIGAALLLMALLFQFSLEQRTAEIGTLLALGFTPRQVRRLFLREGAALAFLGGLLGTIGGIGYARAMLHGLTTIWRDAVGASTLKFFVTPQTLVIGLLASTVVAVFALRLALRKQARQPARVLLTGALECGDLSPLSKNTTKVKDSSATPKPTILEKRGRVRALQSGLPLAAALGLVAWVVAKGDTANAGAFFGAGALALIAGLSFLNTLLVPRLQPSAVRRPPSLKTLSLRGLTRRRSRSVATAAMLASGTFLIVSIGVFRLDANRDATKRTSGTGGFALIGESTMPVVADLNTRAGRETFALNEADFEGVNVVHFRVRQGDEASCLNLNRAQKPRLLGVNPEVLSDRFTFTKGEPWPALRSSRSESAPSESAITQSLLTSAAANEVPAIGDAASIQWAMGKKVGDTLDYVDERGQPFKVRIVGAVANSILQGQLLIDEAEFVKRFPGESGCKYFLVEAPTNRVADVSAKLSRALQDAGLELTPAPQRLAQFNAVQNTYLGTFQLLGGLGLLLGSAGLGIVVLRNVLERRAELAVLRAVGWRQAAVRNLVLLEHATLLGLGLLVGLVAAAIAVLPGLFPGGTQPPFFTLGVTLALVVANGLVFTWVATRFALRGDLLVALRNE